MLHTRHLLGRPKNSLSKGAKQPVRGKEEWGPCDPQSSDKVGLLDTGVFDALTLDLFVSSSPFTHLGNAGSCPPWKKGLSDQQ